jgi:hypothetical protein
LAMAPTVRDNLRDDQEVSRAKLDSQKHFSGSAPWPTRGVLPATRRVWRRTRSRSAFAHKSRRINSRAVGSSPALSLPTAPAAEEVAK